MPIKLANNASGLLATAINASDTGIVLRAGDGAEFPTLGVGDYFYATLTSTQGTQEIVKVTARVGDTMTVVRAQEGTTANGFAPDTRFELRVTAASVDDRVDEAEAYALSLDTTLRANLAASSGASLVGYTQGGTNAVATTAQAKLRESVSVKDFGAVGDGVTNDTEAFQKAAAYINAQSGGKLVIPAGTYIVGKQTFAGQTGLGYAYRGENILYFQDCAEPVVVEAQGAKIKIADGLRFGSFDPVTGAVFNPSLPFTDNDYRAQIGITIGFFNNKNVSVVGALEIDGNIQNAVVGGGWGDTGRQLVAYGIWAYNNDQYYVENVWTHHHCLDGLIIGYTSVTDSMQTFPHTLVNVNSEFNARQGLSWVGGNQLTAINCKFNNTQQSTFGSSPGAGLDIEAESSICRNGMFIDCEFSNNGGQAMVADSGDSADVTFLRCKFVGSSSSYVIWPRKPRLSFIDCIIVGAYVNSFTSTTPTDATKYIRCLFTDEVKYASSLLGIGFLGANLSQTQVQTNVLYDSCSFITTRSRPNAFRSAILNNCTFNVQGGTNFTNNRDYFIDLANASVTNTRIIDNITVDIPADGFYAFAPATTLGINEIVSPTGKLKWNSWSGGAGGYVGYQAQKPPDALSYRHLSINRDGRSDRWAGILRIYADNAAPTTGTWVRGDRVINDTPTVGQPKGWVCTVSGTPGTWVSEGNL